GGHWWGACPGSHSQVGGRRWWYRRHPAPWARELPAGRSPAQGRRTLDAATRRMGRVMLELRLDAGLPLDVLAATERRRIEPHVAAGRAAIVENRVRLPLAGRLLAVGIVRDILD